MVGVLGQPGAVSTGGEAIVGSVVVRSEVGSQHYPPEVCVDVRFEVFLVGFPRVRDEVHVSI